MRPLYRIIADNQDVTEAIGQRLASLAHRDQRGLESDTLTIEINDDGTLELPKKGVELNLHVGFEGQALVDRGRFVVDEVTQQNQGHGDRIRIVCRAADMRQALKSGHTRSWDNTTLDQVVADVAAGHNLQPRVATDLANIAIEHIDQTNESDLHFITRIAQQHDAQAKINDGYLVIAKRGTTETTTGEKMEPTNIVRSQGDTYRYTAPDRSSHGTVQALYYDTDNGETLKLSIGSGDPIRRLRTKIYANESEARTAAQGEISKLSRGKEKIEINLAVALPNLFAEMPVTLTGWRKEIDGDWATDQVETTLRNNGLTQRITLQRA